ncbi:ring domain protein [Cryptosporidium ryanae]|uniref:ring domain protein n=1 Tax=Cryptosporidium ryanae TaxID=515981 RepID=UPI003519E366|nr:ring domain protein [Cryptosporidium ryanae]
MESLNCNETLKFDGYFEGGDSSEESCVGLDEHQVLVIDEIGDCLNDTMEDNNDSFGVSFYDDLIDISSIGVNQKDSLNTAKSLEDEVTLKSKIENSLGLYRIGIRDLISDRVSKLEIIKDISIGFSNNIIGKGNLFLVCEAKTRDEYILCWDGNLLDCFCDSEVENENSIKFNTSSSYCTLVESSDYSINLKNRAIYLFPLDYVIDVQFKSIEETHFIFIKSDFQLNNETIFIQFSFNSSVDARHWFDIISRYKAIQNKTNKKSIPDQKNLTIDEDHEKEQLKEINKNNCMSLVSHSDTFNVHLEQSAKSVNSNSSNTKDSSNKIAEISFNEKKNIEETIKNLIFTDFGSENTFLYNTDQKSPLYEYKRKLRQKCCLINEIVESIKNDLYDINFIDKNKLSCPICCETFELVDIVILNPCQHQICRYCENKLVDSVCPWDRSNYEVQNYLDKLKECGNGNN